MIVQFAVSIKNREKLRDVTGDPWDGRSLEWATSSPPPAYNFAFTPVVHDLDAWYDMKSREAARPVKGFRDIHMPKNTGAGVVLAALSAVVALAMIWYIWWLAILGFAGIVGFAIWHSFDYDRDFHIPAEEVTRIEDARTAALGPAPTPAGA